MNMKDYKIRFLVVLMVAALSIAMSVSYAGAVYLRDGTKEVSPGVYVNPNDGMCVVGLAANGNMLIDASVTNARDCVAYTTGLTSMTTQASCAPTNGGVGTDGYRHTWATSNTCINAANPAVAISLVDLDRTLAMCLSKGGTTLTSSGTCVAYGWLYRNVKVDGSLPDISGGKGVTSAANLGFCYTSMRMTTAGYTTAALCPSSNNDRTLTPGNYYLGPDGVTYFQTEAGYNAGLGWSFASSQCVYAYGIIGYTNGTTTKLDGTTLAANTYVNLTAYTTQGDCLANGFLWENWLPVTATTSLSVATTPSASTIRKFDALSTVNVGGGEFVTRQCVRCHTDQSRAYAERLKLGFTETGHKKSGNSSNPIWAAIGDPWGVKGVQCSICHAASNPTRPDLIQVSATTGIARSTSTHDANGYGSAATAICFTCHGVPAGGSTNPAGVIPTSGGGFGRTIKDLAPIANQFLNSPHAKYSGTSSGQSIMGKANYSSAFVGNLCRTSNSIGGGSIITTMYQSGAAKSIPLIDRSINPDCSNAGTGSATSGAAGFWVNEGSGASDAQGNCTTCHDSHWSLDDSGLNAEPVRRECTTCHSDPAAGGYASASGAQQIMLSPMKHPAVAGTPLVDEYGDLLTGKARNRACETCHMPKLTAGDSPMHLWRISTNPGYSTAGAGQANLVSGEAFVDLDAACGQCHGASGSAHLFSKAILAGLASGMHSGSAPTTDCAVCHATAQGASIAIKGSLGAGKNHHGAFVDCSNCHQRGGVEPTPDNAFCTGCHNPSNQFSPVNPGVNHHIGTCIGCHIPGDTVGAGGVTGPGVIPVKFDCNTCHPSKKQSLVNHPNNPPLGTPDCSGCHGAGGFQPTATVCNSCHGGSSGPGAVTGRSRYLTADTIRRLLAAGIHKNAAPVASMTVVSLPGRTIRLTDTSTDIDGNLSSIRVEWGNGKVSVIAPGATINHVYTKTGVFTIKLTAADAKGLKSTISRKVTVIR